MKFAGMVAGAALSLVSLAPASADVIQIKIDKLTFAPAQVSARVGDTIEWVNTDFLAHTATARDKTWDITIAPGKTARMTVKTAGAIDYYCRFHPNMTGRLAISDK